MHSKHTANPEGAGTELEEVTGYGANLRGFLGHLKARSAEFSLDLRQRTPI
jgi:hypothetical protein